MGDRVEGKQILFPDDPMEVVPSTPGVTKVKHPNRGQTPAQWRKKDVTKDDMQLSTPLPKSARGGANPSPDAPKEGEEGGDKKGSENGVSLDDALPTSPPPHTAGENAQQQVEEGEGESN